MSQKESQALIDAIPHQIWSGPADGSIDFCNERWLSYMGMSLAELQGKGWQSMLHPDDRERVLKAWQESVANETPYELEERHRSADGSYRWFLSRGVPFRDDQGHVVRWYGTNTDIEDRKQAELALQRAQAYLAIGERLAGIGTWAWNPSTGEMYGSQQFHRIFCIDPDKAPLTRQLFLQRIHPEDRPGLEAELSAAVSQKRGWEIECRVLLPGGVVKHIYGMGQPQMDGAGEISEFICTAMDISSRKRAEERLRESEARFRGYFESPLIGCAITSPQNKLLAVNDQLCKILGYSKEELIRMNWLQMTHPDDLAASVSQVDRLLAGEVQGYSFEKRYIRKDGSSIWAKISLGRVNNPDGSLAFICSGVQDITERKHAEEELQLLFGRLLRLQDEERRRIARDLHDASGQDLVALTTTLGQLRDLIPSRQRKSRKLLSECQWLAGSSLQQIRTLSYVLHPPVLDQAGLGDAIRDYAKGFSRRSGIHVDLEISPRVGRLDGEVEMALFRVMQESLTNVQRHSGSQRVKIRVLVNSELILEVTDRRRSASNNTRPHPSEPAFNLGVGIPSMQERVKSIGGRLEIVATGDGTVVRAIIPLGGEREKAAHFTG